MRRRLFVLAYNLGNFLRQAVLPRAVRHWTLTTLREKLIKIGAKVVRHARQVVFQMAEVAVPAGAVPGHSGRDSAAEVAHTDGGLTPAGRKSQEGAVLEATLCLRLAENRC